MRPVVRGEWPKEGNRPVDYADNRKKDAYQDAKPILEERIGRYCSFCERKINAALELEHFLPKKPEGAKAACQLRKGDWHNFLLSCKNCNSIKGNNEPPQACLRPDKDNTFRAILYQEGGLIQAASGMAEAQALMELVGLHKTPKNSTNKDKRFIDRKEAWDKANRAKARLLGATNRQHQKHMEESILEQAEENGHWSIWMNVFHDLPDMRLALIDLLPGTCTDCFDAQGHPVPRPGGAC